ncbi:hypothetical protein CEXT_530831 [Caerostris extrusa]|uniref:Uncharacterized protein n=1 Tax=Caerostris extrusa TaxID=172846 RepID=A0AAV4S7N4_CAEEX|nr:hypothetical protein CEXT_530831 [Caerostris extrusa]
MKLHLSAWAMRVSCWIYCQMKDFLSKCRYISVSGHLLYSVSPLAFYWQPIVMSDGTVIAESSTFSPSVISDSRHICHLANLAIQKTN